MGTVFRPICVLLSIVVATVALSSCSSRSLPPAPTSMMLQALGSARPMVRTLSGMWKGKYTSDLGNGTFTMKLAQTGDKVTGTIAFSNGDSCAIAGKVKSGSVTFTMTCTKPVNGKGFGKATTRNGDTVLTGTGGIKSIIGNFKFKFQAMKS